MYHRPQESEKASPIDSLSVRLSLSVTSFRNSIVVLIISLHPVSLSCLGISTRVCLIFLFDLFLHFHLSPTCFSCLTISMIGVASILFTRNRHRILFLFEDISIISPTFFSFSLGRKTHSRTVNNALPAAALR